MQAALADSEEAQAIDTTLQRRKRSTSLQYQLFEQPKTFYEARDFCEQTGMQLSSTTDDGVLSKTVPSLEGSLWLDLIQPEPICKNTKCYSWHSKVLKVGYFALQILPILSNRSPYINFNSDIEWRKRPSFRYTSCKTKLPFLCVAKQKIDSPENEEVSCKSSLAEVTESKDKKFPRKKF